MDIQGAPDNIRFVGIESAARDKVVDEATVNLIRSMLTYADD